MRFAARYVLSAVAIAVVAALLYLPTIRFGYTQLDDVSLIVGQAGWLTQPRALLEAFTRAYDPAPHCIYYRPLVTVSFVLNALLGGVEPGGYHLANTLLHALASVLVFALAYRCLRTQLPALLGALFFAVSPANTATVAWLPGRNDSLLVCFAVGALLLLLRNNGRPSRVAKVLHLLCFAGALFTKETAVCLPLVFAVALWALGGRHALRGHRSLWVAWGLLLAGYLVARSVVLAPSEGAYGALLKSAILHGYVPVAELGKLLFPLHLQVLASPEDLVLWPGVLAGVAIALSIALLPSLRTRRLAFIAALIGMPLLLNVLAAQTTVLENRLYLPMVGMALWASELSHALGGSRPRVARWAFAIVVVTLIAFGARAWHYSECFADPQHFAKAAFQGSPRSSTARYLLFRSAYRELGGPVAVPTRGAKGGIPIDRSH